MAQTGGANQRHMQASETMAPQRYFPIRAGYTWTYVERVTTPLQVVLLQRRVTLTVQHSHQDEHVAYWHFQSGATVLPNVRYRLVKDGIQQAQLTDDTRYTPFVYLLKTPLVVGTMWQALHGATIRIAAVGVSCTVPAGEFSQCVETLQESEPTPENRMTTQLRFALDIGVVWQQRNLYRQATLERYDIMELQKLPGPIQL